MTKDEKGIGITLRKRYILALSIIASLVILSQLAIQFSISKNGDDSRIINIAGRQRMLSQRITKCVLGMFITEDPAKKADYLAKLTKATELWEISHKGLQYGNAGMGLPGNNSEKISKLFARIQGSHLKILEAAKAIAALERDQKADRGLVKKEIGKITDSEGEFLNGMDTIVFQYDTEAKAKVELVKHIEIFLSIITLFVLALEAILIFRPAELEIRGKIAKIMEDEESINCIFETAPIAMFLVERESLAIIKLNRLAECLLDVGAEQRAERSLTSFWDGYFDRNGELRKRMISQEVISNEEVEVTQDGRKKGTLLLSSSHMLFRGSPVIIIGVSDVSRQKELEQQLRQAQKMEAMGQLAGGIAHDFNNLLTAVIGNLSLVKMLAGDGDRKLTERVIAAETASNRAKELTQRLLTFSRGGAPIKNPVHVAEIVTVSAGLALSGSKSVCEYEIPDDLWPVDADDAQIGQVIGNLIINAHQAMPEGGRIKIRCENTYAAGHEPPDSLECRTVRISISDEGVGIPPDILERIFDPFFTTKEKGRGLGLATSYSIIKNHDGHIDVESEEGRGTSFIVTLPASQSAVVHHGGKKDQPVFGTGKVLVMDDEEMIRETAKEILTEIGYTVELAGNGDEAIDLYQSALQSGALFDAVIMDLTVPGGMGGKQTASRLREIDPHVRTIVSSGYSNDPIMANFREYGFDEVVSKPYDVGELSQKLAEVIHNR